MSYTVKDIENLTYQDIMKMSEKELRDITRVGVSAANKRIKRAKAAGKPVKVGNFSIRGKSQQQVRGELNQIRKYLGSSGRAASVAPAKKYTVKDIENLTYKDILKMSDKELRAITRVGVSAANKRLKRMEEAGVESAAAIKAKEKREKFSIKGKTTQQVRSELNDIKKFITSKGGSLRGAKELEKKMYEKMGVDPDNPPPKEDVADFWKAFNRLYDEFIGIFNSQQIMSALREANSIGASDTDDLYEKARDILTGVYEKQQEEASDFFDGF